MLRTRLALTAAGFFLFVAIPLSGQPPLLRSAFHDYRVVTVADGLEHPWSMAFLPGGDMLVTERPGRLRIVRQGTLLADPVPGVPEVFAEGQGGLLDVVLHPDFASNRLLYLSFSKPNADGSQATTEVVRGRSENDRLTAIEELFEPATTAVVRGRFENDRITGIEEIFEAVSQGRGHYGSRLAFDRDGFLFITVGERQAPARGDLEAHPAQDLTNHHGTTIRLHDDGRVPADNPFADRVGALPEDLELRAPEPSRPRHPPRDGRRLAHRARTTGRR